MAPPRLAALALLVPRVRLNTAWFSAKQAPRQARRDGGDEGREQVDGAVGRGIVVAPERPREPPRQQVPEPRRRRRRLCPRREQGQREEMAAAPCFCDPRACDNLDLLLLTICPWHRPRSRLDGVLAHSGNDATWKDHKGKTRFDNYVWETMIHVLPRTTSLSLSLLLRCVVLQKRKVDHELVLVGLQEKQSDDKQMDCDGERTVASNCH